MKKLLFAVGGTGGHLFPAQALARELKELNPQLEILFAGGKLSTNRFFEKSEFPFREVASNSPYKTKSFKSFFDIGKGVVESLRLIDEFEPNLIIGFGSFYSFPILLAARLKKIPYILVNSDAIPGRVNRFFGKKALFTALQFEGAVDAIKGKSELVTMPIWSKNQKMAPLTPEEARKSYGLDPYRFTILIFGGSQGANPINDALKTLKLDFSYQLIHFCGDQKAEEYKKFYNENGVSASVKAFEPNMPGAFAAANLVICRGGAGTQSELIEFGVPSIIVPWPGASENHQYKNGLEMQRIGGAIILEQSMIHELGKKIEAAKDLEDEMRKKLGQFRSKKYPRLSTAVLQSL